MNPDEPINHKTREQIARLDERIARIMERMDREERANQRAIKLASNELARRLDILNHDHARTQSLLATFMPRELYETSEKRLTDKLQALESAFQKQEGRLWLPLVAVAAAAAAFAAAVVKFLFS